MATGDVFIAGGRFSSSGEVYTKTDPTTVPSRPDGVFRVALDASSSFYDGFDAALDVTNRWTAGGTSPTVASGILSVSAATTALATSTLTSKPSFPLLGNMFVNAIAVWKVDAAAKTGAYRFFGVGVAAGSPTVVAPITDGAGFEYRDTDGALNCVTWAGGVRSAVPFLSSAQITAVLATLNDGAQHRYATYYKTSVVYFEIDNVVVASVREPNLTTSTLPVLALTINGAATVTPAAISQFSFIGVGDTASNGQQVSDGAFPWQKAQIGADGAQSVRHSGSFQATYSAAFNVAAAATATDIAVINGSATKTIYITKAIITGIQTTAGLADILLIKRSTADTGGTSTAQTAIPHDSADAAASGTVLAYTANPGALGTSVGSIRRAFLPVAGAASVVNPVVVFDFGDKGKPITLRGIAQQLAINLNGVTLVGGSFDINFEWYEI